MCGILCWPWTKPSTSSSRFQATVCQEEDLGGSSPCIEKQMTVPRSVHNNLTLIEFTNTIRAAQIQFATDLWWGKRSRRFLVQDLPEQAVVEFTTNVNVTAYIVKNRSS